MSQDCPQTFIGNIQLVSKGCTTWWSTSYNFQGHLSEIRVSIKDQVGDTISGLHPTHVYIICLHKPADCSLISSWGGVQINSTPPRKKNKKQTKRKINMQEMREERKKKAWEQFFTYKDQGLNSTKSKQNYICTYGNNLPRPPPHLYCIYGWKG